MSGNIPGALQGPNGLGAQPGPNGGGAPAGPTGNGVGGPPPPTLPRSGLVSIGPDFDFLTWRTPPPAIPSVMPLDFRHADNVAIEKFNDASIRQTLHYEMGIIADDVGAPLQALYAYSEDEISALLDDTLGTLQSDLPSFPKFLRAELGARKKAKDAKEKEKLERDQKEKEARKVKPFKPTPDAQANRNIAKQFPEIYKVHVACGLTLPFALLLDSSLRIGMNQDNLKTRTHSKHNRKDATVVNEKETLRALNLPADELLTLGEHDECIVNYTALLKLIAPSSEATGTLTNTTYEFRNLACWFFDVRERAHRYPVWRRVEKMFITRLFDEAGPRLRRPPPQGLSPSA
ncbi:hypothetical protein HDZ31DRAFT_81620 [Schizophyllum fasciatum]